MSQDREDIRNRFNKTYGSREVKVIPASPEYQTNILERHERVGPYSRVSTMSGEQVESFEAQKRYYAEFIERHPNWEMVDMYADEGISATSISKRKDFQRLIRDCKEGKVSLILTKTVTRFARNVVDCIETCRDLKCLNPPVGVFFEADGINTLEQQSELHLSMLAILAQSESETKSTSVRWALRTRFAKGIPRLVKLYGYTVKKKRDLQPDEVQILMVDEEEASVVKFIYEKYIEGCPISYIATLLRQRGIPSPQGNDEWSFSTIAYILTNERYAGNITSQKTLVVDIFSHKSVKNVGQLPQYELVDTHEGIISVEDWLYVQNKLLSKNWEDFLDSTKSIVHKGIVFHPLKP